MNFFLNCCSHYLSFLKLRYLESLLGENDVRISFVKFSEGIECMLATKI